MTPAAGKPGSAVAACAPDWKPSSLARCGAISPIKLSGPTKPHVAAAVRSAATSICSGVPCQAHAQACAAVSLHPAWQQRSASGAEGRPATSSHSTLRDASATEMLVGCSGQVFASADHVCSDRCIETRPPARARARLIHCPVRDCDCIAHRRVSTLRAGIDKELYEYRHLAHSRVCERSSAAASAPCESAMHDLQGRARAELSSCDVSSSASVSGQTSSHGAPGPEKDAWPSAPGPPRADAHELRAGRGCPVQALQASVQASASIKARPARRQQPGGCTPLAPTADQYPFQPSRHGKPQPPGAISANNNAADRTASLSGAPGPIAPIAEFQLRANRAQAIRRGKQPQQQWRAEQRQSPRPVKAACRPLAADAAECPDPPHRKRGAAEASRPPALARVRRAHPAGR